MMMKVVFTKLTMVSDDKDNDEVDKDDDEGNGHKMNNGMDRTKVFPQEVVTATLPMVAGSKPDLQWHAR